jgi:hypothetical protein
MATQINTTVYAMLSSAGSSNYTDRALESFRRSTSFSTNESFYLIDNDATEKYNNRDISVITPSSPQSFSRNVNDVIDLADGRDIFILSNDVVFTPGWNIPLLQYSDILLIPSCNQTHLYTSSDGLLNR